MKLHITFFLVISLFCGTQLYGMAALSPFDPYTTGMLTIVGGGFYIANHGTNTESWPVRRAFRAGVFTTVAATTVAVTCAVPGIPASAVFLTSFCTAQLFVYLCSKHKDFRTENGTMQAFIHGMASGCNTNVTILRIV